MHKEGCVPGEDTVGHYLNNSKGFDFQYCLHMVDKAVPGLQRADKNVTSVGKAWQMHHMLQRTPL